MCVFVCVCVCLVAGMVNIPANVGECVWMKRFEDLNCPRCFCVAGYVLTLFGLSDELMRFGRFRKTSGRW